MTSSKKKARERTSTAAAMFLHHANTNRFGTCACSQYIRAPLVDRWLMVRTNFVTFREERCPKWRRDLPYTVFYQGEVKSTFEKNKRTKNRIPHTTVVVCSSTQLHQKQRNKNGQPTTESKTKNPVRSSAGRMIATNKYASEKLTREKVVELYPSKY